MADAQVSDACGFLYVWVQVPSSAPETTEIEPELYIRKRVCGFYLRKVRKKHKVKRLVLFLLPTQENPPCDR